MAETSGLFENIAAKKRELETLSEELQQKIVTDMPIIMSKRDRLDERLKAGFIGVAGSVILVAILSYAVGGKDVIERMISATGWFGVSAILVSTVALVLGGALAWPDQLDKGWTQLERVATSGAFYFFAGLALLLYSIHTTASLIHPSLTFLLAMLGVAIMLFGTGSQAVGAIASGGAGLPSTGDVGLTADGDVGSPLKAALAAAQETHESLLLAEAAPTDVEKTGALPGARSKAEQTVKRLEEAISAAPSTPPRLAGGWSPFAAHATVAGGAAVLTALFGYGVIVLHSEIKDVFGFYDRYVRVRIEACASLQPNCMVTTAGQGAQLQSFDLTQYGYEAELINGAPVFASQAGNEIQLLVFQGSITEDVPVRLKLTRLAENKELGPEVDRELTLVISPEVFKKTMSEEPDKDGDAAPDSKPDCIQFSEKRSVKCALSLVASERQGEQINTVLYSLNMFHNENTGAETKIDNNDVTMR